MLAVALVVVFALGGELSPGRAGSSRALLWRANMETGDLSQWKLGGTGGLYNSGSWDASVSTARAHSGRFSLKATISTPSSPTSAVRAFRWDEARAHRTAFYSAWFYFPAAYTLTGNIATGQYWNIMQFKSRTTDDSRNDPIWMLNLGNRPGGGLLPHLVWSSEAPLAGPHQGESGYKEFAPRVPMQIPVGRWVHFEAFLRQSKDFDGQVALWQDGVKIFDLKNVRTSYDNPSFDAWHADDEWSANNYSDGVSPNPATLYIDDAVISTRFVP